MPPTRRATSAGSDGAGSSPTQEALGREAFLKAIYAACIRLALLSSEGYQWVSLPWVCRRSRG